MKYSAMAAAIIMAAAVTGHAAKASFRGYAFEAKVVGSNGRTIIERSQNGRATLFVGEGDEYSIVLRNPLPVRAGVALSVDGLNTIDGKRTKSSAASKWIIEPNSSITIKGWQTGNNKLRRFVFTRPDDSYAEWKQNVDKTDYTRNLGVIGVAWFWSAEELALALNPPRPFVSRDDERARESSGLGGAPAPSSAPQQRKSLSDASERAESKAGTGMGRQENHAVTRVHFKFDTGMYSSSDCLAIYYEFARKQQGPSPFEDDTEGYAPDMHSRKQSKTPWWLER